MKQKLLKLVQILLSLSFSIILIYNVVELSKELYKNRRVRKVVPFIFEGYKFSGLDQFLKGEKYVGYYTDGDTKDAKIIEEYSQAQFVLAPIILDLNNTSHRFIIFNCSNELIAMKKIQELGLRPLKRNNVGIILTQTP